jgi:hypothetical protein
MRLLRSARNDVILGATAQYPWGFRAKMAEKPDEYCVHIQKRLRRQRGYLWANYLATISYQHQGFQC